MTERISFRPSEEMGNKIRELADSDFEGNLSQAVNQLIEKALNMENRQAILDPDDPLYCDALSYIDDHWECTWGRMGKTPDMKKIGISDEARNNRCRSCTKTLDMKERLTTMEQRIEKGMIVNIPSCIHGGKLSDDGKKLYCLNPNLVAQKRDVHKWCKVLRNGAQCESLRFTRIQVKGKLPDGQNL